MKVKAHSSQAAVLAGQIGEEDWYGNRSVDRLAKEAGRWHPRSEVIEERIGKTEDATVMVGKFLVRMHLYALRCGIDATPKKDRRRVGGVIRPVRGRLLRPDHFHTAVSDGRRARCTTCWRSAANLAALDKAKCHPAPGHSLVIRGQVVQCMRCGAFSRGSAINLLQRCRGRTVLKNSHRYRAFRRAQKGLCPITGEVTRRLRGKVRRWT